MNLKKTSFWEEKLGSGGVRWDELKNFKQKKGTYDASLEASPQDNEFEINICDKAVESSEYIL